jgi:hypothetical protein
MTLVTSLASQLGGVIETPPREVGSCFSVIVPNVE